MPARAGGGEWHAARYLDVSHLGTRARLANAESGSVSDQSDDDDRERSRRDSVTQIDLSERNLRFARFRHAQLRGAKFESAQLQRAEFTSAQLQNADFTEADLQRASLNETQLQGADFYEAQLQGARLYAARLQETNLRNAELHGAIIEEAYLQGANLRGAQLTSADLGRAEMQGAILWDADLSGSNLTGAQLQGAKLNRAWLRGANLSQARMEAVDIDNTRIGGANLTDVRMLCSHGIPTDWHLAWMPRLTYRIYKLGDSVREGKSDEAVEILLDSLIADDMGTIRIPYEDDLSLEEHLRLRLKKCGQRPFSGTPPDETDLVVHSGRPPYAFEYWPASATTNAAYWKAWGDWTVEFACGSEHHARSSIRRWSRIESRFGKGIPDAAVDIVRSALIDARSRTGDCPGLSSIPDDDHSWMAFVNPN